MYNLTKFCKAAGEEGVELVGQLAEDVFSSADWEESIIMNLYKG